mgnify:CR=1 FL=1|jgi:hypothetical protein
MKLNSHHGSNVITRFILMIPGNNHMVDKCRRDLFDAILPDDRVRNKQ